MQDIRLSEVPYFSMERAMRAARERTKEAFRQHQFGITIDQWLILKCIADEAGKGISQVEIANNTFKDPAAVTRILDLLSKKQLITRKARPDDRRTHEVLLTEAGQQLFNRILPVVKELRERGLRGLQEKEIQTLQRLVNRIYFNME